VTEEKSPESVVTFSERAPAAGTAEDRQQERFDVDLAVTVDSEHNFYAGYATNLSASGVFVATTIVHPVGTRFSFTIQLAETREVVRGVGEVRWLRPKKNEEGLPAGIGIQFLEVEGDGAEKIGRFLSRRQPMTPPSGA
jgi:uncharacterized protein (TIGR02266 family)